MSESREHKRRYNLRLEFIAEVARWLDREPPMILFWRWWKWKKERPIWEKFSQKEFEFYFQGHELDKAKMAKELGDVSWYLALTAYAIGYDLEDIFRMNIEKLKARYPEGFSADRSLHRQAGDI